MIKYFVYLIVLTTVSGAAAACAEATEGRKGSTPSDPIADAQALADGGAILDSATKTDDGSNLGDSSPSFNVVFNEIAGKGKEWIEIYNIGSTAVDLSGFSLADREKDAGTPKLSAAVNFPSGTRIAPRGYLLVQAADSDSGAPADCPGDGGINCFVMSFGISNKDGETLFLIDPARQVAAQSDYPANTVGSGQTWCRVPDGVGQFVLCTSTRGRENVAAP